MRRKDQAKAEKVEAECRDVNQAAAEEAEAKREGGAGGTGGPTGSGGG